jgi:hypothetical protein
MEKSGRRRKKVADPRPPRITSISVAGFKSIKDEQSIEIRPLTILAGANSSGKSSIMQPLLLLKQTLEAPYDPGPLELSGPNVSFTTADQVFFRSGRRRPEAAFKLSLDFGANQRVVFGYQKTSEGGFHLKEMAFGNSQSLMVLSEGMKDSEVSQQIPDGLRELQKSLEKDLKKKASWAIVRQSALLGYSMKIGDLTIVPPFVPPFLDFSARSLSKLIHVAGSRGDPSRTYKRTAVRDTFPGRFEVYTASVIFHWQTKKLAEFAKVGENLRFLGLTSKVVASPIGDTEVELLVGRLLSSGRGKRSDLVSIADVGFGVSQCLPAIVALLAAKPGNIVYLEQPEIHLHPKAQNALAKILADAAKRGVLVVAETHSSLLLRGIQTLVAKGKLASDLVKLHWFQRDPKTGCTEISSRDLNQNGAFGDWPVDFDEVTMDSERDYLDAVEKKGAR